MTYRTSKCPYCSFVLESMSTSPQMEIGPKYLPCPKCRKLYSTGAMFWDEFSKEKQDSFLFGRLLTALFVCAFLGLLTVPAVLLIPGVEDLSKNMILIIWGISFVILFLIIIRFDFTKRFRKKIENNKLNLSEGFEEFLYKYWQRYIAIDDEYVKSKKQEIETRVSKVIDLKNFNEIEEFFCFDNNINYEIIKYMPITERLELLDSLLVNYDFSSKNKREKGSQNERKKRKEKKC